MFQIRILTTCGGVTMIDKAVIVICENDEELEAFLEKAEHEGLGICERTSDPCPVAIRIDHKDLMHICTPETYIKNPHCPEEEPITFKFWQDEYSDRYYTSQYYRNLAPMVDVSFKDAFESLFD